MTRILFWCEAFWPSIGGVEVLAGRMLASLHERGYECVVVTDRFSAELPEREDFQGIPVHRFPFREAVASTDLRRVLHTRQQILHLKRAFRPDLVYVYHGRAGVYFHLSTSAAAPAPVLATLHGTYRPEDLMPGTALGALLHSADWVTACSSLALAHTLQYVPQIQSRAAAIPNALGWPAIQPRSLPFDPPRLLCLGRLSPEKGFDVALEAYAILRTRCPQARLVVAGDGRERANLERQAATLGLGAAVDFIGWVDPPHVPALLNTATVVVMPSLCFEGFGLVALQAAQMARPVVASRDGGLPEVVLDGQTGLLVDKGDPEGLAQAIALLLEHPNLAVQLGQAARHRARMEFRWESHMAAYERLFARLVQRGATAGATRTIAQG
jgi:glycogen(starch) synthase